MENTYLLLNINLYKRLMYNRKNIDEKNYLEVKTNPNNNFKDILNIVNNNTNIIKTKNIFITGDYYLLANYIKINPQLKKYRLIINKKFNLNTPIEELEHLEKIFQGINNIYIKGKHNIDYVPISEYKNAIKAINSIAERINKYDLSPLEQVLYVYDFVRQKEYKEEDINEPNSISRDMSKVLFNDKIVCVGYSNLFNAILDKLNINSNYYAYKNINKKKPGHATNVVKIDDEKYNIHGLYYFDITKDRCKGNEDYLNSYLFFAKTKENFDEFFDGIYKDISLKNYNLTRIKLLKIIKHIPRKDNFSIYLINKFLNIYN